MPVYEYSCPNCGVIELIHGMNDPSETTCLACNGSLTRLISRQGHIIADEMKATQHMGDGKYYTSKSEFRKTTKTLGYIEVGTETLEPRKKNTREHLQKVRDTMAQSYAQLKSR